MRALCVLTLFTALCITLGCDSAMPDNFEGPRAPVAHDAFTVEKAVYCRTVAQPGLAHWDRDVLTSCPDSAALDAGASCTVSELVGTTTRAVEIADVRLALRASAERMVVLKTSGALVLRAVDGAETLIAAWAVDPSVAADGVRVAFVTVAIAEPGTATRVVLHDLRDGSVRIIADDPDASSPFVVPDSDDVVYISSRSGLASIWRGNGEYEIQVTNVDLESGDQGVLPTFGSNVLWVPGVRVLAFTASTPDRTTESTIWKYDVALGVVEPLGPGAWPQIAPDGTVLAAISLSSDAGCAVTYLSNDKP